MEEWLQLRQSARHRTANSPDRSVHNLKRTQTTHAPALNTGLFVFDYFAQLTGHVLEHTVIMSVLMRHIPKGGKELAMPRGLNSCSLD
ncbi:hypothetical protein BaRGS_00038163 [Batillaria attramentaria]|uniref:Uncharacterized protein n=1 Tax=Batillaria attramentaria TaxID=370345 RepID=A0ABD0J6U5_9CAEN